ncbi:MAG: cell division protein SepF [Candidatus Aenigmarchaeota archaeon]|nr:cell division protein SepF [Candidatus Aenigmarchaeota archaeon]
MAISKKFFGGRETLSEEEFLEIGENSSTNINAIPVKITQINDYGDVDSVQKLLREGNIVFAKIKTLKEKDLSELKRAISRLRKTVTAINGDIAGVDENYIVATPSFARVDRGSLGEGA